MQNIRSSSFGLKTLSNFRAKFLSVHDSISCTVAMARKPSGKSQGGKDSKQIMKAKGPVSEPQAL